jgi:hypothetical protein
MAAIPTWPVVLYLRCLDESCFFFEHPWAKFSLGLVVEVTNSVLYEVRVNNHVCERSVVCQDLTWLALGKQLQMNQLADKGCHDQQQTNKQVVKLSTHSCK